MSFNGLFSNQGYNADWGCSLSTAIVSTYVPSKGFVIGADGMRHNPATGEVILTAQKLFSVERSDTILAYGWSGTTIFNDDSGKRAFSILEASSEIIGRLRPEETNFADYVTRFLTKVNNELALAKEHLGFKYPDYIHPTLGRGVIANVLIDGYFQGKPWRAQALLRQSGGTLGEAETQFSSPPPVNFCMSSGSKVVWDRIRQRTEEPGDLPEAATAIHDYIQLCSDNRTKYPDCVGIGGHIHIASVTPTKFRWIEPPIWADQK